MAFNVIHTPLRLIIHQQVLPLHFSRAEYLRILARRSLFGLIVTISRLCGHGAPPKATWGIDLMWKREIHLFLLGIYLTRAFGFCV